MKTVTTLCPSNVVAAAAGIASTGERVPPEFVLRMRRRCGCVGDGPWHTAFVHHVGYTAHHDPRLGYCAWPLPATADCGELADFAHRAGVLVEDPRDGDVFLLWSAREGRFVRSGIVVDVSAALGAWDDPCFTCSTVEGDTTRGAALTGPGVHRLERRVMPRNGHRFIRWADLDGRKTVAERPFRWTECIAWRRAA